MWLRLRKRQGNGPDVAANPHAGAEESGSETKALPVPLSLHQPIGWGSAASVLSPGHVPNSLLPKVDERKTKVFDDELE